VLYSIMFMNQTDFLNILDVMISLLNSRVKNESKWVWFASVTKIRNLLAKMSCMDSTEECADLVCVVDCNKNAVTAHRRSYQRRRFPHWSTSIRRDYPLRV